ncbi:WD40 repeat domain-containing protein [Arachnia propionica]|uniref:WD40 repeat domain-containing protein n=1 Tax=Arachnia propionica TaxID=1750 RepID=A0A3P1T4D9_9ACTN|nr:WD40 repeat domain-containing protein [Arachnia propionica]RRD03676.1 WD40 repeat domain-containing protein [Arachnia propionica]
MTTQPRVLAGLGGWEDLWSTDGWYLWWSADGDRVLVVNRDLFLHDACTGALLRVFPKARFHVHGRPLSHDDERVLAGDGVWDTATMRELFRLHHPRGTTAEWSLDGTLIALASPGRPIALVDGRTGAVRHRLETSTDRPHPPAWSPDGRHLAVGGIAHASVWDTATGEQVLHIRREQGPRRRHAGPEHWRVFWESDQVLVADSDDDLTRWGLDGSPLGLARRPEPAPPDLTSPDGTCRLVPEQRELHVVTEATGHTVRLARAVIEERPLAVTGQHLVIGSPPLRVDLTTGAPSAPGDTSCVPHPTTSPDGRPVDEVILGPDGRWLACLDHGGCLEGEGLVSLWRGGQLLHRFEPLGDIPDLIWSPDGTRLLAVGEFMGLRILDAHSFEVGDLALPHPHSAAWSPDGERIVAASDLGLVVLDLDGRRQHCWSGEASVLHWVQPERIVALTERGMLQWDPAGNPVGVCVDLLPEGDLLVRDSLTGALVSATARADRWFRPLPRMHEPART